MESLEGGSGRAPPAGPRPFQPQQKDVREPLGLRGARDPHLRETLGALRFDPDLADLPPGLGKLCCALSWATASRVGFQVKSVTVNG